jgi:hypothetical protein
MLTLIDRGREKEGVCVLHHKVRILFLFHALSFIIPVPNDRINNIDRKPERGRDTVSRMGTI